MKSPSTNCITALQLAIGTFVLAVTLRTWFVMGLIEPVTVAGSSMAPTLMGSHVSVQCERCHHRFAVGAEFATEVDETMCPQCRYQEIPLAELSVQRADRLVIDRTAFMFRLPQRWEPVVFVSPADEGGLVVKRVVGLPGETIQLRDGNVWINGRVARKNLDVQKSLRHLVHRETTAAQRWQGKGWSWNEKSWKCEPQEVRQWLKYRSSTEHLVNDDLAYNAGLSRRLFTVCDVCLVANLCLVGSGELAFRLDDGEQEWEIQFMPAVGRLDLSSEGILVLSKELTPTSSKYLRGSDVRIEIGICDQQLYVAIEDQVELTHKTKGSGVIKKNSRSVSIGARALTASIRDLTLYRDTYYASREEAGSLDEPMAPVFLGENEIFVLGDNAPVSIDSRHWGPLPLRLLVGRPLGVR